MKKIKLVLLPIIMLAGVLFFAGCKKEETADISKTVKVSYPTINLIGPAFVHISVGEAYTDQGATLVDDVSGASTNLTAADAVENTVDINTPGIYIVRYVAANENGFEAEGLRTVLVLDYTPPGGLDPTFDISGSYIRPLTGVTFDILKMDNGLYIITAVGGSTPVPAYFTTPTTSTIDVPPQVTIDDLDLDCTGETLIYNSPTDITIKWTVVAAGFGTAVRTYVKQ